MMTKKVLLVEDELSLKQKWAKRLVAEDFEADIAVTQNVARDMLCEKSYDLCLIDIRTPGMSGMELYHYLKNEQPELPVKLMFTTTNSGGDGESGFGEVRRPPLSRPFSGEELRDIVRQAAG